MRALLHSVFEAWSVVPASMQQAVLRHRVKPFNFVNFKNTDRRRLLILPANSAGQGYAWADACDKRKLCSAANLMVDLPTSIGFPAHFRIDRNTAYLSKTWQGQLWEWIGRNFTHVLLESGTTITGPPTLARAEREINRYIDMGLRVGLIFHGSDIREITNNERCEPDSPFPLMQKAALKPMQHTVRRNQTLLKRFPDLHRFVSTPDLLDDVPEATWLPVIRDQIFAGSRGTYKISPRPRIVHVPSRSVLKGTDQLRAALDPLADVGIIEYVE